MILKLYCLWYNYNQFRVSLSLFSFCSSTLSFRWSIRVGRIVNDSCFRDKEIFTYIFFQLLCYLVYFDILMDNYDTCSWPYSLHHVGLYWYCIMIQTSHPILSYFLHGTALLCFRNLNIFPDVYSRQFYQHLLLDWSWAWKDVHLFSICATVNFI